MHVRRLPAVLAALALCVSAGAAAAETVAVPLNHVVKLGVRGEAADILIGSPDVADVALLDSSTLAVSGKAYGTTNLMVLDASRRVLFNGQLTVTSPPGQVTVFRGPEERKYACVSRCEAVPQPGRR